MRPSSLLDIDKLRFGDRKYHHFCKYNDFYNDLPNFPFHKLEEFLNTFKIFETFEVRCLSFTYVYYTWLQYIPVYINIYRLSDHNRFRPLHRHIGFCTPRQKCHLGRSQYKYLRYNRLGRYMFRLHDYSEIRSFRSYRCFDIFAPKNHLDKEVHNRYRDIRPKS